jgi:hypothetical protein
MTYSDYRDIVSKFCKIFWKFAYYGMKTTDTGFSNYDNANKPVISNRARKVECLYRG